MVMRFITVWLIVGVLVSGCGFHLRGRVPLPESLSVIAVDSGDAELRARMVEALETAGASIVVDKDAAKAVLKLHDIDYQRRVRSIDTRGKVTGYTLVYSLSYTVTNKGGKNLRQSVPIQTERDFNFDSDQVLQKESEERVLREDMLEDIAQRIIRQLSTITARTSSSHRVVLRRQAPGAAHA